MATDLYILSQTARRPAVPKREIYHWFAYNGESAERSAGTKPILVEDVNVVIGDGDVFVRLGKGEQCFIRSRLNLDGNRRDSPT